MTNKEFYSKQVSVPRIALLLEEKGMSAEDSAALAETIFSTILPGDIDQFLVDHVIDMEEAKLNRLTTLFNASPRRNIPKFSPVIQHASLIGAGAYEKGQIYTTPCRIGDTLYTPFHLRGDYLRKSAAPYPVTVVFMGINDDKESGCGFINVTYEKGRMFSFNFSDFGKLIFHTPEEAKKSMTKEEQAE